MYTRSMDTIYLSLRAQVAVGTFFMISPVAKQEYLYWNGSFLHNTSSDLIIRVNSLNFLIGKSSIRILSRKKKSFAEFIVKQRIPEENKNIIFANTYSWLHPKALKQGSHIMYTCTKSVQCVWHMTQNSLSKHTATIIQ